ncbi:MAG: ATP-binding cassette domain-containing protein, partial [Pseudomonadota bacterium]
MSELLIDNISMRFDLPGGGHVQALKDVNLKLKTGELMSVLGPSGCGKTTLLRALGGFVKPDAGEVLLEGRRVEHLGPEKRPTGMVFQI